MLKAKKDLIPGTLKATPAASRKAFKVEGLNGAANTKLLEQDVQTKPRFKVTRQKLSGGTTDGYVIFGDALVSFLTDSDAVSFSQPYANIFEYGRVKGHEEEQVYWVFYTPGIIPEPVRYVFILKADTRDDIPADTTPVYFWLEEMDRAFLENERRRYRLKAAQQQKLVQLPSVEKLNLAGSSSKIMETLAGQTEGRSQITSMFSEPQILNELVKAPRTVGGVRFPAAWVEWKEQFSKVLVTNDESIQVVIIPMHAGVMILNPCTGNADFLGEIITLPWGRIRSWGNTKTSFSFNAIKRDEKEVTTFIFRTPRFAEMAETFQKVVVESAQHRNELFPERWPPLRYEKF